MKDIPLVSLANILHRGGLYNNALIVTNMALEISPKFVVTHFTMANIYVSKVRHMYHITKAPPKIQQTTIAVTKINSLFKAEPVYEGRLKVVLLLQVCSPNLNLSLLYFV